MVIERSRDARPHASNYIWVCLVLALSITTAHTQTPGFHIEPTHNVLFGESMTNAGTKFMWIPSKHALRAGEVQGTQWDLDSIGDHSVAFGRNNQVSGVGSLSWGGSNTTSGNSSASWGVSNETSGSESATWGEDNTTSGNWSATWGEGNTTSGDWSATWGEENTTSRSGSATWGFQNTTSGAWSATWGFNNKNQSIAETVIGRYADTVANASLLFWQDSDQLLAVGNGTADDARNNALTLFKNGELFLHTQPENKESILIAKREGPKYGGAGTFDFSTDANEGSGFVLESKARADNNGQELLESSGIYGDGQSIHIWSPGDENLLNVHDEDGMENGTSLKWWINGSGNPSSLVGDDPTKRSLDATGILDKALKVSSISFRHRDTAKSGHKAQASKLQYSFDPVTLKKQFPDLVTTNQKGQHYVQYSGMIPILLEAIKEQQNVILKHEVENATLLERIERLERLVLKER